MAPLWTTKQDEEVRRGPWTEQEDAQLVCFVRLFGERRWDLLAKVSGLNRTGKSCRLRWVNYLHPGLKRGRMTPEEEHLVLELHAELGNRWSRIARRLPGRTDNEIKNYWRTHMRKKAQEIRKRSLRCSSPSSSCSCSSSSSCAFSSANEPAGSTTELVADPKRETDSTTEGSSSSLGAGSGAGEECLMDQIWNEIAASSSGSEFGFEAYGGHAAACGVVSTPPAPLPIWQDCSECLWRIDDDELIKMLKYQQSKEQYHQSELRL